MIIGAYGYWRIRVGGFEIWCLWVPPCPEMAYLTTELEHPTPMSIVHSFRSYNKADYGVPLASDKKLSPVYSISTINLLKNRGHRKRCNCQREQRMSDNNLQLVT